MKFGVSRTYPIARVRKLCYEHYPDCELFGVVRVPRDRAFGWEHVIHGALAPWRAHHEWFRPSAQVLMVAQAIRGKDIIDLKFALHAVAPQRKVPIE